MTNIELKRPIFRFISLKVEFFFFFLIIRILDLTNVSDLNFKINNILIETFFFITVISSNQISKFQISYMKIKRIKNLIRKK